MPTPTHSKEHSRGFTIIELLIVTVVVTALAAVTFLSYNTITAQAKDTTVESDIATIKKRFNLFLKTQHTYPISSDTAAADIQLGSMKKKTIVGNCTSAPTTKDTYCLYSDSNFWQVVYWSPAKAQWRIYSENTNGTINEYNGGTDAYAKLGGSGV